MPRPCTPSLRSSTSGVLRPRSVQPACVDHKRRAVEAGPRITRYARGGGTSLVDCAESLTAERVALVGRVVDAAPKVIPEDLLPLFARSAEPRTEMM